MHRRHVHVLGLCLAAWSMAIPASAQSANAAPKTEISAGYQFVTFSVDDDNESIPKGWYFDVTGNLNPMIGVIFQVGGNYKTFEETVSIGGGSFTATADLKVHEFLGGFRLNARDNPKLVPYGQILAGAINGSIEVSTTTTIPGVPTFSEEDSSTNFALAFGGGVNFGVSENTGIRFGVDYMRIFEEDAGSNVFRFQVGVVFGR